MSPSGDAGSLAPVEKGCALVTGASRGIGAAIARALAADGWAVGINYRSDRTGAESVADDIRAVGGEALMLPLDVADPSAPDRLCSQLEADLGRPVLVLVNNAAAIADGPLVRIGDDAWSEVMETNLAAAFRLSRRVLRPMMRQRFGRIVNVASVVGQTASAGQSCYAASKAGLVGLTKTLAVEVASRSVTVNAVAPGVVDTDGSTGRGDKMRGRVPMRRAGTPEDVAGCVRFLASEEAGYVTGSVLTVDGGLTA